MIWVRREGSPPQVRGKHYRARRARQRFGITPAGAGKTCLSQHPRQTHGGSPPQVRGKLPSSIASSILYRITPAGAGKTPKTYMGYSFLWDHPRRCGENNATFATVRWRSGSPPQVRGKQAFWRLREGTFGITPAGAGKTAHSA